MALLSFVLRSSVQNFCEITVTMNNPRNFLTMLEISGDEIFQVTQEQITE